MFLLHRWIFQKTDSPGQGLHKPTDLYSTSKTLFDSTNLIKHQQVICDLTSRYATTYASLKDPTFSQVFVVSVVWNENTYDMLINDQIQVADILERLVSMGVLIGDDAVHACLQSHDRHQIFELEQRIPIAHNNPRLLVQLRERPAETICISILGIGNTDKLIEVQLQDTIAILKLKILICFSIFPNHYFLTFRGESLLSTQTLADYNIKHGSRVVCCIVTNSFINLDSKQ